MEMIRKKQTIRFSAPAQTEAKFTVKMNRDYILKWLLLLLTSLQLTECVVQRRVAEGVSTNVDIQCNLDRHLHPKYWIIQGRLFDLGNVPEVFTVTGDEVIRIREVDRRMNGWRPQCYSTDSTNGNDFNLGVLTVISVFYG